MGIFDTMNQKPAPTMGAPVGAQQPNAMGQGFAQQQQMQKNPMMQGRPQMQQRPNPMQRPQPGQAMGGGIPQAPPTPMLAAKQQAESPIGPSPQSGIPNLMSPYDQQQLPQQQNSLQAQLRESAVDMGSQDPRELARMHGTTGNMPMNLVPELPMGDVGRPDVMPRGLGPSNPMESLQQMGSPVMPPPMMMDENGLEPRRGAR